jgi:hypothetical protein
VPGGGVSGAVCPLLLERPKPSGYFPWNPQNEGRKSLTAQRFCELRRKTGAKEKHFLSRNQYSGGTFGRMSIFVKF